VIDYLIENQLVRLVLTVPDFRLGNVRDFFSEWVDKTCLRRDYPANIIIPGLPKHPRYFRRPSFRAGNGYAGRDGFMFFWGKKCPRLRLRAGASNAGVFRFFVRWFRWKKGRVSLLTELENVFE